MNKLAVLLFLNITGIWVYSADNSTLSMKSLGYQLGKVDKEVLKKAIIESGGYDTWQAIIERHIFEKSCMTKNASTPIPIIIECTCEKNDGSVLSQIIFDRIHSIDVTKLKPVLPTNPLNRKMQNNCIDYCTSAESVNKDIERGYARKVSIKTIFFDKKSLLSALQEIQQ